MNIRAYHVNSWIQSLLSHSTCTARPGEVAGAAAGGRRDAMFDALHGDIRGGGGGIEEDAEFNDARPFRQARKKRKTHSQ
jgi:hypothetical protein